MKGRKTRSRELEMVPDHFPFLISLWVQFCSVQSLSHV